MEPHYLLDILILLGSAIVAVPLFQFLGLGAVLGYLAAGSVVGPWGLGFINQTDEIRHLAEFGVVFLLFIIGIELKPAQLWSMRRSVFGLGTTQLIFTGAAISSIAWIFQLNLKIAVIVGFGLALSSTAFGLQILNERGELNTGHGKTTFSILLLQDLAVVPLLTLVSLLASESTTLLEGIEYAILDAFLVVTVVVLSGRFLLSPLLKMVASRGTAEIFTAAAVFFILMTAWLLETIGLSLALGAFIAGLLMSESHYRHQIIADIEPFRGILLGLFFMAVGMQIDFTLLAENSLMLSGLVLLLLFVKASIAWSACRLLGVTISHATRASMLLSQSGEFGFVLFGLAFTNHLIPDELFHMLTLIIVMSMVTTPFMYNLSKRITSNSTARENLSPLNDSHIDENTPCIIIAGFGRVGRRVAELLRAANLPYLAIEKDADRILKGRQLGFSVFYGDASQADVLKAAGADQATVLVCTLDNTLSAVKIVTVIKQHYPNILIHARGHDRAHCEKLLKVGATTAISETLEESIQLGSHVLETMKLDRESVNSIIETFRQEKQITTPLK